MAVQRERAQPVIVVYFSTLPVLDPSVFQVPGKRERPRQTEASGRGEAPHTARVLCLKRCT